jgi:hypothetical protein
MSVTTEHENITLVRSDLATPTPTQRVEPGTSE